MLQFTTKSLTVILVMLFCVSSCYQKSENSGQQDSAEDKSMISYSSESTEAIEAFQKGMDKAAIGDGIAARMYFDDAIEMDQNFAMAYAWRGFWGRSAKEYNSNIEKASSLKDSITESEKLIIDIFKEYRTSNEELQLSLSKELVEKYADDPISHYLRGIIYGSNNQFGEARASYQKAIDLDSTWVGGYQMLGNSYIFVEPKDFNKAETNLAKLVELEPYEAQAHINLGDAYRAQNKLDKAAASYSKAIELDDNNPVSHTKLGHANSFLGNLEDARTNYQNSRKSDEFIGGAINFEGYTYLYANDHETALNYLNSEAVKVNELELSEDRKTGIKMGCINSCTWIAMHYDNVQHIDELNEMVQPLAQQVINDLGTDEADASINSNLLRWQGISLAMKGNYEEANAKAEEMKTMLSDIKDQQKLQGYYFLKGFIAFKQKAYDEAIEHLDKTSPFSIYSKYLRALAYEAKGDNDKATELYKKIVDFNFNGVQYAIVRNAVKEKLAESEEI